MLLPRFLTALIGVPLLILSIWWGQIPFMILVFGVIVLSLYEFYTLVGEAHWPVSKNIGLFCGILLALSIVLFETDGIRDQGLLMGRSFLAAIFTGIIILCALVVLFNKRKETSFIDFSITLLGIFYVVWPLSHLFLIRDIRPDGRLYTFFLFFVIWSLDIGAYFGGKKFGKNKLSESISPKKTWEGVLAGSLSALAVSIICRFTFLKGMSLSQVLVLALFIIVLAQLSDLSESLFKRNVKVKDSGNLLPGHGGLLDRFDSFIFTAPVFYYVILFFVRR